MLKARLWYGPAGQEVGLERVAHYLRGPLACELSPVERHRRDRWVERLALTAPLPADLELNRGPDIPEEAALLVKRLPAGAPLALAHKLSRCTARLELFDAPHAAKPFTPASATGRSVLLPLAYAMGGIVEDVDSGRLSYHAGPVEAALSPLRRALAALTRAIGR